MFFFSFSLVGQLSAADDVISFLHPWNPCEIVCFIHSLFVPIIFKILITKSSSNLFRFSCDRIEPLGTSPVFICGSLICGVRSSWRENFLIIGSENYVIGLISQLKSLFFVVNWFGFFEVIVFCEIYFIKRPKIIRI